MTTLAITYRFVAPNTMLDAVAGAIARSLFKTKALLVAKTPLASQIEAPDPDDKNPVLAGASGRRVLSQQRRAELLR